jgi:hypothetical protein
LNTLECATLGFAFIGSCIAISMILHYLCEKYLEVPLIAVVLLLGVAAAVGFVGWNLCTEVGKYLMGAL